MQARIPFVDADFIEQHTNFRTLIAALRRGFAQNTVMVPVRHSHDFPNPTEGLDSTLLLMPAWNPSQDAGVKIVTVSPHNGRYQLPSVHGLYVYLDALTGRVKAMVEAESLTAKRTAATSALASSFLSKPDASSMLMIGTGALSSNLIRAHAAVRPIRQVYVWGRDFQKAERVCRALQHEDFEVQPIRQITDKVSEVDIISCATLSPNPLVLGEYLRSGQHVDLVGSFKKDMREANSQAMAMSRVFIDTPAALQSTGDLLAPMHEGVLTESDIQADLFELCSSAKTGRQSVQDITLFKSVGHALEDLVAAKYYVEKYPNFEH